MDAFPPMVYGMLASSPQMMAAIVGVVVAAVFWGKMPGPAPLLLLASLLEMVVLPASGWYRLTHFPAAVQAREHTVMELARHATVMGIAASLAQGIVFGLLVWAVVAGRGPQLPPAMPGR